MTTESADSQERTEGALENSKDAATAEVATTGKASERSNQRLTIAYLIPEFPGQTHIFFWRERKHLVEAGLDVRWISTRPPQADSRAHHDWAEQAARQTDYLTPMTMTQKLRCMGTLFRAGPGRLVRAMNVALGLDRASLGQRVRALAMLVPAARLKQITQHAGIRHIHVHSAAGAALIAMLCHLIGGPGASDWRGIPEPVVLIGKK